jgi:DNA-3-methyladenine glycosylase
MSAPRTGSGQGPGSLRDPPSPPQVWTRVPRDMCRRPSAELARALLGLLVVRAHSDGITAGRIVETEAYAGPADLASHARAGRTARTATMFGPPGHAYVYLVYGLHHCLNVVAEEDGIAGAVLIRALAPVSGVELMARRRGLPQASPAGSRGARLCAGPARLCQALAVDRGLDREDLSASDRLWLALDGAATPDPAPAGAAIDVVSGPRVGVDYAGPDWAARPWRFGLRDHPSLSRPFTRAGKT